MKRDAGMAMAQDTDYTKYSDYTPYSNYGPYSSAAEAEAAKMEMGMSPPDVRPQSPLLTHLQSRPT